jgi:predicted dehydrogenase
LEDDSIAVVGLYTQPNGRAKLLREILRAGKDVMTTKPFELDAEEAEDILREAQSLGRVIHLNSPCPEPTLDLAQIQAWVQEFNLGRLVGARGEVWAPYLEKADGSWMDDPMLCPGGAMMRLGIYLINDIIRLAGPVDQVNLVGSRVRTGRPTPDNALLTMSCASGCMASVYASFCVDDGDRYSNGLTLNYEQGTIYRNIGPVGAIPKSEHANLSLVMRNGDQRRIVAENSFNEYSGIYQWEKFYRAIVKRESISDGYIQKIVEGVKVLEAMRGMAVSA